MEKNIPLSLQGDLTAALQYLKGADENEGEGLFIVTGKRGMVLNWKVKTGFQTERGQV